MTTGKLYIISAPSGAGKTSLIKQIVVEMTQIAVSISHTTRKMRADEQYGKDYFFVSVADFQQMADRHDFLENAQVFDNFYGTARQAVENTLNAGTDVILEIDWQGAQQIRTTLTDSISIFILPPSIATLQQRLKKRGQDSQATIKRRMDDAIDDIAHCREFDYIVVNNDFKEALLDLKSIIISQRLVKNQQLKTLHAWLNTIQQDK